MARTFALSTDEDWALAGPPGQQDLVLITYSAQPEEFTRASILGRVPIEKGTWRYNTELGVDWPSLQGIGISEPFTIALVTAEIQRCEGVTAVLTGDFTIVDDVDNRERSITGPVYCQGDSVLAVVIPIPT